MSEMVFRPRKGRKRAALNVTSLIDVLFLLLIFFMLTSTFRRGGHLQLELPESSTASPLMAEGAQTHQAEVTLMEDGTVLLDEVELEMSELPARLRLSVQEDPEMRLLLKAEAGARHGDVVRVLDIVRESGFPGVSIGTEVRPARGETP